jgi:hypothetical protein
MSRGPRVLFFDIETCPIVSYTWGLWDQNVSLNQVVSDWSVIAWSARWQGDGKHIYYKDQRGKKDIRDDKELVSGIWTLLDAADIVVTQNGKSFDQKKLNARFIIHGLKPPSAYKHIDTLLLAKKHFAFTSNKLEYMAGKLNTKYKKLTDHKFPGFELWKQCMAGNLKAWKEMERYNKHDVLALEELYDKLIPWDTSINFSLYRTDDVIQCTCGKTHFQKRGFYYTASGKYQKYRCMSCGSETYSGKNLLNVKVPKGVKR